MTDAEMIEAGISPCAYRFNTHPTVRVEWRGPDMWAIVNMGACLNRNGTWEYEPLPSNRNEEFIERTRYPLNEALRRTLAFIAQSR